ncbi:uncharacterized protein EV154DRAFT_514617 [Mucor mucedo]|uniref:uncharacterized protein n=1 Tax=Mucor mucedo TaxID=29922 RepID=UPI00221FB422|nr:uncharacterized protein EV154DRAFT_514617 [Mucor mucedo]KAI7889417.1 hypothetical protein EV154DRAFT_514617 [Mucor mucedo]
MKKLLFTLYLVSLLICTIQTGEITGRNAAVCGFASNKIFCYGGSPGASKFDSSMLSLDIKNQPSNIVSNLYNKWKVIQQNNSELVTEYRYDSNFVMLPDGVSMLFEGGANEKNKTIANKTVIYNTAENVWHTLPDFNDPQNGGFRQIYSASTVYMPNINCVGFYGGKELHSDGRNYTTLTGSIMTNVDISYPVGSDKRIILHESYVGFYYMTLLNLTDNTWHTVPTEPLRIDQNYPFLPIYQSATYSPITKKVYYLGGVYHTHIDEYVVPLSYTIIFDTISSNWENQTLNAPVDGSAMPAPRQLHTATLLNTQKDILVYGGTSEIAETTQLALPNYVFTLNVETLTWISHDIDIPSTISGPRFYHSAVLVDETSVFIMFGKPRVGVSTTDNVLVLDARNASAIAYSTIYPLADLKKEKTGISTGAIVGIVVGVLALLSIVLVAVFLCIRKRKREMANEPMEQLEVDWDNIDTEFREEPPVRSTFYSNSMSPSSTMISSPQVPSSIGDPNVIRRSMNAPALPLEVNLVKPDGVNELVEYSKASNEAKLS